MDRKYNLRLDLQFRCNNSPIKFDEFDKNTSDFFIRITKGNKLIDISKAIVTLAVIKPDKTADAQFVEIRDNNVYCDLKSSMKDIPGKYEAIASIVMNNEIVITDTITYEVAENKILKQLNTEVVSEEKFTLLTDMINRLSVIENSEEARKLAELSREEAEKQREIAKQQLIDQVNKLIADTSLKVDTNLKENSNKVTKLISDTETKIDNYTLEKDAAIQQDLQQYKTDTTQDIDNYKNLKDSEIDKNLEDYKTATTKNIDAYKNLKNTEIDNYKTEKDLEIDTYVVEKNKELDIYAAAKNAEINEYKDLKDTLINDKLREVDVEEQKRAVAEQQRVTEHADREAFLNTFESQLGQIQTDVNELKNNNTGGNANIDDTQVSTDTTWSSDKISTWSMEQDGVFWTEKEDNFISADDTYEYKLKEVEIFGDTWQDSDSKNLVLFDASLFNDSDISKITVEKEGTISFTNSNLVSTKDIQLSPNTEYTIHAIRTTVSGDAPYNLIRIYENNSQIATVVSSKNYTKFTTSDTGVIKISFFTKSGTWTNEITKYSDLMIFKGADNIKYEPYHKADLSNIQHAGELYIDEEGQPILDSEGREQYKIEIESAFGINLAGTVNPQYQTNQDGTVIKTENGHKFTNIRNNTGTNIRFYMNCDKSKTYTIQMDIVKNSMTTSILKFLKFTVQSPIVTIQNGDTQRVKFKLEPYANDILFYLNIMPIVENEYLEIENLIIFEGDYTNLDYNIEDITQTKQTILLPCQLMKVGDVKDRLFWDESKGRYVVEKVFDKYVVTGKEVFVLYEDDINTNYCRAFFDASSLNMLNLNLDKKGVIGIGFEPRSFNTQKGGYISVAPYMNNRIYFSFKDDMLQTQDNTGVQTYFKENPTSIFYPKATPQLIETNITEQLTIPTYNNKTHVYIVNSNNAKATIKAKFPLKTASAVATLNIENDKNSKDIQTIEELNVDMVATTFDMDYRLLEVEWALEDAGITGVSLANILNTNKGVKNMALSRYEQAKIMILGGAYDKETLTRQLTRYVEKKIITQSEYDELIALMEAKELVTGE